MICNHEKPFVWDEAEWKRHIESVCILTGEYEGDEHIVTAAMKWSHLEEEEGMMITVIDRFYPPWLLNIKKPYRCLLSSEDLQPVIDKFVEYEQIPEL